MIYHIYRNELIDNRSIGGKHVYWITCKSGPGRLVNICMKVTFDNKKIWELDSEDKTRMIQSKWFGEISIRNMRKITPKNSKKNLLPVIRLLCLRLNVTCHGQVVVLAHLQYLYQVQKHFKRPLYDLGDIWPLQSDPLGGCRSTSVCLNVQMFRCLMFGCYYI